MPMDVDSDDNPYDDGCNDDLDDTMDGQWIIMRVIIQVQTTRRNCFRLSPNYICKSLHCLIYMIGYGVVFFDRRQTDTLCI